MIVIPSAADHRGVAYKGTSATPRLLRAAAHSKHLTRVSRLSVNARTVDREPALDRIRVRRGPALRGTGNNDSRLLNPARMNFGESFTASRNRIPGRSRVQPAKQSRGGLFQAFSLSCVWVRRHDDQQTTGAIPHAGKTGTRHAKSAAR
jgi:hypothetical protein